MQENDIISTADEELRLRYEHEVQLKQEIVSDAIIYFELNLSTRVIEDYQSKLHDVQGLKGGLAVTREIDDNILLNVAPEYREAVSSTLFCEPLAKAYESGRSFVELVYRRTLPGLGLRWVRGTASLMKRPDSNEIIAFLRFRDIDEKQKDRLALASVMDEEIDSVAVISAGTGLVRLAKEAIDWRGEEAARLTDLCSYADSLLSSGAVEEDRTALLSFFSLDALRQRLDAGGRAAQVFRLERDGQLRRKLLLAYYLDDTHEDIVLSRRDITAEFNAEKRLSEAKRSEELLRLVVAHSERVIYRYDVATRQAVSVEPDASRSKGLPDYVSDMPESLIRDGVIPPEDADYVRELFRTARARDPRKSMRFRARSGSGAILWLDVRYSFMKTEGAPDYAIISCLDITKQHESEIAYARYLQTVDEDLSDTAVYFETDLSADVIDKQGGVILPADFRALGHSHTETLELLLKRYFPAADRARVRGSLSRDHLLTLYGDGTRDITEDWNVRFSDKRTHWLRGHIQLVRDPYTGHVKAFATLTDVTAEKNAALDILRRAELDGMTGLYNKATTERLIRERLETDDSSTCALLIVDLDYLKTINDTLGHAEGDKAIRQLSEVLRAQFRHTDIVGRVGGDEFAAFLCGITETKLRSILAAFMHRLSAVSVGNGGGFSLCGSVGAALGNCGSGSYEELFRRADRALYHVKRNGKNDYAIFTPDMEDDGFRYESQSVDSKWQSGSFDSDELDCMLKAVSVIYPMVISCNLTQNSFYMLQYEKFTTHQLINAGTYDELIDMGESSFHPEDRESFRRAFSTESMLGAFERGERMVSHIGRQLGDDGVYRSIRTDAIFVRGRGSGDVMQISLAREVDS